LLVVLCTAGIQLNEKRFVSRFPENVNLVGLRSAVTGLGESNYVALKSAVEDFESTTLGAIPGLLAKLHYIAGLHDGRGNYAHWGMGRTHGEGAAQRAMRASHAGVLAQVLRTPLRELDEDLRRSASGRRLSASAFLASLKQLAGQALPDRSLPASEKHLKAVLDALSALLEAPALASRPDASPLRRPVR
jgi:hypothetical protein